MRGIGAKTVFHQSNELAEGVVDRMNACVRKGIRRRQNASSFELVNQASVKRIMENEANCYCGCTAKQNKRQYRFCRSPSARNLRSEQG